MLLVCNGNKPGVPGAAVPLVEGGQVLVGQDVWTTRSFVEDVLRLERCVYIDDLQDEGKDQDGALFQQVELEPNEMRRLGDQVVAFVPGAVGPPLAIFSQPAADTIPVLNLQHMFELVAGPGQALEQNTGVVAVARDWLLLPSGLRLSVEGAAVSRVKLPRGSVAAFSMDLQLFLIFGDHAARYAMCALPKDNAYPLTGEVQAAVGFAVATPPRDRILFGAITETELKLMFTTRGSGRSLPQITTFRHGCSIWKRDRVKGCLSEAGEVAILIGRKLWYFVLEGIEMVDKGGLELSSDDWASVGFVKTKSKSTVVVVFRAGRAVIQVQPNVRLLGVFKNPLDTVDAAFGPRHTSFLSADGRLVVVPNAKVVEEE
jgi:hypothetical protein